MEQNVLDITKQALAVLDFTEEDARYAEIQTELEGFTEAQEKIRARSNEIDEALRDIRDLKAAGAAKAADRLLDGGDVAEIAKAVSTEQNLRDERASLNATYGDLTRRHRDLYPELQEIQARNRHTAFEAARPLFDAVLVEAREAAERLATAYAALDAVTSTTRHSPREAAALQKGLEGLRDFFHATGTFPAMVIPEEVRDALLPLESKGRAASMRVPAHVHGYALPAEPTEPAKPEHGPSKLESWLVPAWARGTESITFPN